MAIESMTGFARAAGTTGAHAFAWEVRSVNGRGLDVRVRPRLRDRPIQQAFGRRAIHQQGLGRAANRDAAHLGVQDDGAGGLQIDRLDASGGVVVRSPSETARGDFGIYDLSRDSAREFMEGYEAAVWLDFNVQGSIWDRI